MGKPSYFKRKHKRSLVEIILSAVLLAVCVALAETGILPEHPAVRVAVFLLPYAPVAWRVLWKAGRNMTRGQVFDENLLMSLATIGAFATGEYPEAVFVMLFYRVGELFEELAVGKSRASIAALMAIRPDTATVEREGEAVTVDPSEVAVGEIIRIRPGERVPLDGEILEGESALDTAALTGEALPRDVAVGETVISGCVNLSGLLRVKVTKPYGESTVAKILELVENAGEHKSRSEHFITRFARYYTPAVVVAAALLATVPPLLLGAGDGDIWRDWIGRALSFLVISCPCALVISVPLSFFGGIGGASRRGILIKGSSHLEALAACDTVVLDKTGTLTAGRFSVRAVMPAPGFAVDEVLTLAAAAEQASTHPIARALVEAAGDDPPVATDIEELAGQGIRATVGGRRVAVGNRRLMEREGAIFAATPAAAGAPAAAGDPAAAGAPVYVAVDGAPAGRIEVADTVKPDAASAVAELVRLGVRRTVMLSGDSRPVAEAVAAELGLTDFRAELLPADKVACLESILTAPDRRPSGRPSGLPCGRVAYVGDGINDAPVLARADIGVAMGAMGSDAAIEAADVVLMDDRMAALPEAIRLARKTRRIVRENIVLALAVKALVLLLGAFGLANLWLAVFADVGVAVIAILNAMRALK